MILVLRAGDPVDDVRERRGPFSQFIRDGIGNVWDGPWGEHDIRTDEPMPSLDGVAGIVITGSSANVPDRLPWMLRSEDFLREAAGKGVAMLGLCFGHQIMAQALGGHVVKNPRGREIGTVTVRLEAAAKDHPWLRDVVAAHEPDFLANASHVDTVERLPPNAVRLATTSLDDNAMYVVGDRLFGVQFHPEFDADITAGYVDARAALIDAEGLDSKSIRSCVRETPTSRALLASFVRTTLRKTPPAG